CARYGSDSGDYYYFDYW
nr:immunoglobulin heavy chain junction region [Macaca mulatta]MOX92945.1 immunoglobulin heavy chain junction region [Macaca mulatta]MOX93435.1 immunoglobulin heavy chain junction region [Macaca mulatta]MOX94939.1 immunoglobulin heavy chain junction region [Macaca mulatta]MOX96006.1 immunoglobulin heavy chain junction region [Macaca mulatta]